MANHLPVVRLYGHADLFDIEFTNKGGTRWECEVPPDVSDGVYAVELWAIDSEGNSAYWTGELFMTNGVCHLSIHKPRYQIKIKPPKLHIRIIPRCPHGYAY